MLAEQLSATCVQYVRCIKPNSLDSARVFDCACDARAHPVLQKKKKKKKEKKGQTPLIGPIACRRYEPNCSTLRPSAAVCSVGVGLFSVIVFCTGYPRAVRHEAKQNTKNNQKEKKKKKKNEKQKPRNTAHAPPRLAGAQLRSAGVVEAIRVSRAGYPNKLAHARCCCKTLATGGGRHQQASIVLCLSVCMCARMRCSGRSVRAGHSTPVTSVSPRPPACLTMVSGNSTDPGARALPGEVQRARRAGLCSDGARCLRHAAPARGAPSPRPTRDCCARFNPGSGRCDATARLL